MTVPCSRSASAIASADLPLQVGPATIRAGGSSIPLLAPLATSVPRCHRPPPRRNSPPMTHVLTLVADRTATSLDAATIARVRDAIQGASPEILSPGEAADIACPDAPDLDMVRAALGGAPID